MLQTWIMWTTTRSAVDPFYTTKHHQLTDHRNAPGFPATRASLLLSFDLNQPGLLYLSNLAVVRKCRTSWGSWHGSWCLTGLPTWPFYKPVTKKQAYRVNTIFCFSGIFIKQVFVYVEINIETWLSIVFFDSPDDFSQTSNAFNRRWLAFLISLQSSSYFS